MRKDPLSEPIRRIPREGDAIVYVDEEGRKHNALVVLCGCGPNNPELRLTLARIHRHALLTQTGVPYRGAYQRYFWCFPDDVSLDNTE